MAKTRTSSGKTVDDHPELAWLDKMAEFLDDRFRIPGTRLRFGFDALVGLVPYVGDIITFLISGFLIIVMARRGASGRLLILMLGNLFVDGAMGTIPILGDLFDWRYRANKKNVRLLLAHYGEGRHRGSAWPVIGLIILALFGLLILSFWVVGRILSALGMALGNLFS